MHRLLRRSLPPGDWKLAGRHLREVKLNEMQRGAEVIEAFAGRVARALPTQVHNIEVYAPRRWPRGRVPTTPRSARP